MKGYFQIRLFTKHGQWCITSTWDACKCYNQQLFSIMTKHLHTWYIPLLDMDVFIFLLMVVMHLHLFLSCHQHNDKNYDHRGNCMLFWQQFGSFHLICHTLLILLHKSLLSCQKSPDYCKFSAYQHCSHQFEIINYKLLTACHQVQIHKYNLLQCHV